MAEAHRDRTLTIFAILFCVLAVSNFLKPFQFTQQTGLVLLGHRLTGTANIVAGPVFGAYLLVYAAGIWRRKRFALPMAYAYAGYVILNLILFNVRNPPPPQLGYHIFGILYSAVAVGVSSGAAYLLQRRKSSLT